MATGFHYEPLYRGGGATGLPPRHDANPMLLHRRELLFGAGVSFVKIELRRRPHWRASVWPFRWRFGGGFAAVLEAFRVA